MKPARTARANAYDVRRARVRDDDETGHPMAGLREFLNGPIGKGVAIGVVVIGLIVGFISMKRNLGSGEASYLSTDRVFIDTENGKTFTYTL